MEDRAFFLRAFDVSEEDVPFYHYYSDAGNVLLEIFYNTEKCTGAGVYYGYYSITGFNIGDYECAEWIDNNFITETDEYDASDLAEYAVYYTYYTGTMIALASTCHTIIDISLFV